MGASGLGSLLVKEGFLTEQDRLTITKTCGQGSWAFAKSILAIGLLDEDELAAFFAERTRYQIAPRNFLSRLDPSAVHALDKRLATKLEVIPLKKENGKITVGVVDPLDRSTLKQLEFFTGLEVEPVVIPLSQLYEGLIRIDPDFRLQPTALIHFLQNHAQSAWVRQKLDTDIGETASPGRAVRGARSAANDIEEIVDDLPEIEELDEDLMAEIVEEDDNDDPFGGAPDVSLDEEDESGDLGAEISARSNSGDDILEMVDENEEEDDAFGGAAVAGAALGAAAGAAAVGNFDADLDLLMGDGESEIETGAEDELDFGEKADSMELDATELEGMLEDDTGEKPKTSDPFALDDELTADDAIDLSDNTIGEKSESDSFDLDAEFEDKAETSDSFDLEAGLEDDALGVTTGAAALTTGLDDDEDMPTTAASALDDDEDMPTTAASALDDEFDLDAALSESEKTADEEELHTSETSLDDGEKTLGLESSLDDDLLTEETSLGDELSDEEKTSASSFGFDAEDTNAEKTTTDGTAFHGESVLDESIFDEETNANKSSFDMDSELTNAGEPPKSQMSEVQPLSKVLAHAGIAKAAVGAGVAAAAAAVALNKAKAAKKSNDPFASEFGAEDETLTRLRASADADLHQDPEPTKPKSHPINEEQDPFQDEVSDFDSEDTKADGPPVSTFGFEETKPRAMPRQVQVDVLDTLNDHEPSIDVSGYGDDDIDDGLMADLHAETEADDHTPNKTGVRPSIPEVLAVAKAIAPTPFFTPPPAPQGAQAKGEFDDDEETHIDLRHTHVAAADFDDDDDILLHPKKAPPRASFDSGLNPTSALNETMLKISLSFKSDGILDILRDVLFKVGDAGCFINTKTQKQIVWSNGQLVPGDLSPSALLPMLKGGLPNRWQAIELKAHESWTKKPMKLKLYRTGSWLWAHNMKNSDDTMIFRDTVESMASQVVNKLGAG